MAMSENDKQHIIELYVNQDKSIAFITQATGFSHYYISKVLKDANISIKSGKNRNKPSVDIESINQMYSNGLSTYQIAKALNCSDETVRRYVKNMRSVKDRNKRGPETIAKIKEKSIALWRDPEYVEKVQKGTSTEEYKAKLSESSKKNFNISLGKWMNSVDVSQIISERTKRLWQTEEYRNNQKPHYASRIERIKKAFAEAMKDESKRTIWRNKIKVKNANMRVGGWISSSQKQLYYILQTSGICYHEEGPNTRISPFYIVDCVIPKQQDMDKPLIIEVQGEYWHSLPHVKLKDRQKATYIRDNTEYDLLYLEELHMSSFDEVSAKLYGYGLNLKSIECKCRDLVIKRIDESEAKCFYSIFHYTSSVRKGATAYGAYLGDLLVAAISYNYPIRTETATRLNCELKEVLEISRMARRTNLKCKNLLSYFIARTRRLLPPSIKKIVSFSDSTYGHSGGVYKSSGFQFDGIVEPDYHYVSNDGKYHKKTIWDRAKRMKMKENEYVIKHGLTKVMGSSKSRWVYHIK